ASRESEIDTAFATLAQLQPDAGLVGGTPLFGGAVERMVALAARHAAPTIYFARVAVASGGLISYGPSFPDVARRVGIYAGKILNGPKPAVLPVKKPHRFQLGVNLINAKALVRPVPA